GRLHAERDHGLVLVGGPQAVVQDRCEGRQADVQQELAAEAASAGAANRVGPRGGGGAAALGFRGAHWALISSYAAAASSTLSYRCSRPRSSTAPRLQYSCRVEIAWDTMIKLARSL